MCARDVAITFNTSTSAHVYAQVDFPAETIASPAIAVLPPAMLRAACQAQEALGDHDAALASYLLATQQLPHSYMTWLKSTLASSPPRPSPVAPSCRLLLACYRVATRAARVSVLCFVSIPFFPPHAPQPLA